MGVLVIEEPPLVGIEVEETSLVEANDDSLSVLLLVFFFEPDEALQPLMSNDGMSKNNNDFFTLKSSLMYGRCRYGHYL